MGHELENNVIDLSGERVRRVHDLNEKRLQDVRAAFVKALPLPTAKVKTKKKLRRNASDHAYA